MAPWPRERRIPERSGIRLLAEGAGKCCQAVRHCPRLRFSAKKAWKNKSGQVVTQNHLKNPWKNKSGHVRESRLTKCCDSHNNRSNNALRAAGWGVWSTALGYNRRAKWDQGLDNVGYMRILSIVADYGSGVPCFGGADERIPDRKHAGAPGPHSYGRRIAGPRGGLCGCGRTLCGGHDPAGRRGRSAFSCRRPVHGWCVLLDRRRLPPRPGRAPGGATRVSGRDPRRQPARRRLVRPLGQQRPRLTPQQRRQTQSSFPAARRSRMAAVERRGHRPSCLVSDRFVARMRGVSPNGSKASGIRARKVCRKGHVYEMVVATPATATADALGILVPQARVPVFAALADFQEAKDLFARLANLVNRIAGGPGGELYRQDLVAKVENGQVTFACPALRLALAKLQAAEPYCAYCPNCPPAHPGPRCPTCAGRGWTTRRAFDSSPHSARQEILRQRPSSETHRASCQNGLPK